MLDDAAWQDSPEFRNHPAWDGMLYSQAMKLCHAAVAADRAHLATQIRAIRVGATFPSYRAKEAAVMVLDDYRAAVLAVLRDAP